MDMAKPAITHIQPSKDFSSTGTNYTIFFYLPGLSEVGFCICIQRSDSSAAKSTCILMQNPEHGHQRATPFARHEPLSMLCLNHMHPLSFPNAVVLSLTLHACRPKIE